MIFYMVYGSYFVSISTFNVSVIFQDELNPWEVRQYWERVKTERSMKNYQSNKSQDVFKPATHQAPVKKILADSAIKRAKVGLDHVQTLRIKIIPNRNEAILLANFKSDVISKQWNGLTSFLNDLCPLPLNRVLQKVIFNADLYPRNGLSSGWQNTHMDFIYT